MATLATHTANRNAAGAAYAQAAKNLVDAWVELQALDQLSNNAEIAGSPLLFDDATLRSMRPGASIDLASVLNADRTHDAQGRPFKALHGMRNAPAQVVGTFASSPAVPYHPPFLAHAAVDTGAGAVNRATARMAVLLSPYLAGRSDTVSPAELSARTSNRAAIAALRASAGAAYAAATTALGDAYVELGAYDMTLANGNVGGGQQTTFSGPLLMPAHADFAKSPLTGPMGDQIRARFLQLLAS